MVFQSDRRRPRSEGVAAVWNSIFGKGAATATAASASCSGARGIEVLGFHVQGKLNYAVMQYIILLILREVCVFGVHLFHVKNQEWF